MATLKRPNKLGIKKCKEVIFGEQTQLHSKRSFYDKLYDFLSSLDDFCEHFGGMIAMSCIYIMICSYYFQLF